MQTVKLPDGTIMIQLQDLMECNTLGMLLQIPQNKPKDFNSTEKIFAEGLSRQLAEAMMNES